jgi:uncharacterized membrane protein
MKIILIIYLISVIPLATYITFNQMWIGYDGGLKPRLLMTFLPLVNTVVMLVCVFYIFPDEYIKTRRNLEYEKHRKDVRWKLMNIKQI